MKSMLILVLYAFAGISSSHAHPYSAQWEFLGLKRSGEFVNYLEGGTYLELKGTSFVGLQSASNGSRTCLFGVNRTGLDEPGSFQFKTRFVCFPAGKYVLHLKKEWCELGSEGCEIDPGGISVGIGNLRFIPAIELGESYPVLMNVNVYESSRTSWGS